MTVMQPMPSPRTAPVPRTPGVLNDRSIRVPILVLVGVQIACQFLLLFEVLAPFRIVFRTAAYAATLLALAMVPLVKGARHHPSFWWVIGCIITLVLQILNPTTNNVSSALASVILNLAILSPMIWIPRQPVSVKTVRIVILTLWAFHSTSAVFGVLQVYFPGRFQPALSTAVKEAQWGGEQLKITLAEGETVYRPMGLTDTPGGSASAGLNAFLFGIGLISASRSILMTGLGFLSLPIGLFCIYLSQVRSLLVMAIIISICFTLLLWIGRWYASAIRVAFVVPIVGSVAFLWATALGGESTLARFETLIEDNPTEVYNRSRGKFLEEAYEVLLPEYPFGAGLGRWGMMRSYFGDLTSSESYAIYAEIQWQAWIIDGGVILLFLYASAVLIAMMTTLRLSLFGYTSELRMWACLISAYNVALFATTFSFVPFVAQSGMEFWMMNAIIYAANHSQQSRATLSSQ
jgi:hypothetical protein